MTLTREHGRQTNECRPFSFESSPVGFAVSSILLSMGNTKVMASVSIQDKVPPFMRGQGKGWLTAEYAMLPTSTRVRTPRESVKGKQAGRSIEISRLIGRSLRSVTDLTLLGEKTITIDCDVLQADGGTRAASITAASVALDHAMNTWVAQGLIPHNLLTERIAALSGGLLEGGHLCVDLNQAEDNAALADVNFVMTESGHIIEVQGTGEREPLSWENLVQLKEMLVPQLQKLFTASRSMATLTSPTKNITVQ
ncbi:MAG: ribonuclease PH [Candidatus Dependentiae bacterium]|jgi:ribonuclease PH